MPKALIQKWQDGQIVSGLLARPVGREAVEQTLRVMAGSIQEARLQPTIRALAESIVKGLPQKNYRAEAEAVQIWVQDNIRYLRDPRGNELLQSPLVTLAKRQGDCDDQTALTAALLASIGQTVRLVAVAFKPGKFAHVLTETQLGDVWTPVETTEMWPLGQGPQNVVERMTYTMPGRGGVGKIKRRMRKLGRNKLVKGAVRGVAAYYTGGASEAVFQARSAAAKARKKTPGEPEQIALEPATLDPAAIAPVSTAVAPAAERSFGALGRNIPLLILGGAGVALLGVTAMRGGERHAHA